MSTMPPGPETPPEKYPEETKVQHHLEEELHIEHIENVATIHDARVTKVHNAAFAAAAAGGKLNPWSRESFILYGCAMLTFLCACANGYDGSLMTGINIMPYYQRRFTNDVLGSGTGLVFSMYTIGGATGPIFAGQITDYFGRRGGMFTGGIIIIIGAIVIGTSMHIPQFLAGRFILGFGVSIMTTAAPTYVVETVPPQWRGRLTGIYNCGWNGGSIPAAGIVLGTQAINNDWSWRIPLLCQCVPSLAVICLVWFCPESPRWLLAHGREKEAHDFLTRFHGNGDPNNPIVQLEWAEFTEGIELEASDKRWWDYSELFTTPGDRYRMYMVIIMGVAGQFSGNGLGYFNTQIYAAVGYDTIMQWILNLCGSIIGGFCSFTGAMFADKMPRRQALVWGSFWCGAMLGINAGLSMLWANTPDDQKNLNVGRGAVASYFLFGVSFAFAYTPLQALYPVECLRTTARAKGMAVYACITQLISFINLYCTPIALQNIAYKYTFIFLGWDMLEAAIWYFMAVETVGRTLEELDEIFIDPHPVRKSLSLRTVAFKKEGTVAVVDDV